MTHPDVLIVGQGLAGTLLGWELERAGLNFALIDAGHAAAASRAGAGIVNPVTGRRFVPSWRIDELRPLARAAYRAIEEELGLALWREMRIRRVFAGPDERHRFEAKHATGDLRPYVVEAEAEGFWVEHAARVDVRGLLTHSRDRWMAQVRLTTGAADVSQLRRRHALVIDCRGVAATEDGPFASVPWECSKGEVLEIATAELAPDVILSRGHWVLPVTDGEAWVGATHEPGVREAQPTASARATLEAAARALLPRPFSVTGHRAGVRVNAPDRRPVIGRSADDPGMGLINGLGAKGTLWAPFLARCWGAHLVRGEPFPAEVDVRRFAVG